MSALKLWQEGVRVHSLRVRGAVDRIRSRQRIEAAIADLDDCVGGASAHELLIVRSVSPRSALVHGGFRDAARREVRYKAGHARRPWLHGDAASADAVLFTDEAELIACLIRDCLLRGLRHWWWQSIIGSRDPYAWLRDTMSQRGDVVVPAIALLAQQQRAAEFVVRIPRVDATAFTNAITRSYALPLSALLEPERTTVAPASPRVSRRAPVASLTSSQTLGSDNAQEALQALVELVPELRARSMSAEQRVLLALSLALARQPARARTRSFALMLHALRQATDDFVALPGSTPVTSRAPDAVVQLQPDRGREAQPLTTPRRRRTGSLTNGEKLLVEASRSDSVKPGTRQQKQRATAQVADGAVLHGIMDGPLPVESPAAGSAGGSGSASLSQPGAATSTQSDNPVTEDVLRADTTFGGIFYLLNVALALEWYGDFTAPRGRNLKRNPWDLLALVGKAWFADEFVDDPIWPLLAKLADRDPRRRPRASQRSLQRTLNALEARLAQALQIDDTLELRDIVARHEAVVTCTSTAVHIYLSLADLPLSIRIAGLDRDPGWIPAAGRSVSFHFT